MKRTLLVLIPALCFALTVWAQLATKTNSAGENITKLEVLFAPPDSSEKETIAPALLPIDWRMFSRSQMRPRQNLLDVQPMPDSTTAEKWRQSAHKPVKAKQ